MDCCFESQGHSRGSKLYQIFASPIFSAPKRRPGMSDVSPCLESQGCDLIPLCYLLFLFCLSCYSFCLIFFCLLVLSSELFPENSSIFFVKRKAFLYGSRLAARRSKLVSGMCSMLSYGTGISCYAFI